MPYSKNPDPKPTTVACRLTAKKKTLFTKQLKKQGLNVQQGLEKMIDELLEESK